jgi:hypothetical protein
LRALAGAGRAHLAHKQWQTRTDAAVLPDVGLACVHWAVTLCRLHSFVGHVRCGADKSDFAWSCGRAVSNRRLTAHQLKVVLDRHNSKIGESPIAYVMRLSWGSHDSSSWAWAYGLWWPGRFENDSIDCQRRDPTGDEEGEGADLAGVGGVVDPPHQGGDRRDGYCGHQRGDGQLLIKESLRVDRVAQRRQHQPGGDEFADEDGCD